MATWPQITEALLAWARKGSGIGPRAFVGLYNGAQDHYDEAYVLVQIVEINPIGEDSVVLETPLEDESYEKVTGQRTMSVRFWFHTFDQTPEHFALIYSERLRAAASSLVLQTTLEEADMSVMGVNTTSIEDEAQDDRFMSIAILDVTFNVAVCISLADEGVLEDGDQMQTIGHVEVSSDMEDAAGESLPANVRMDEETIPPIDP